MSANDQGIIAVTGRAHCQRQVAFLGLCAMTEQNKYEFVAFYVDFKKAS